MLVARTGGDAIMALGHEVKLIHATFVRPFVQGNKTDAADAKAIWTAVRQPEMRTVAGKTEDQQALLALHRMRLSLIKFRTMQVNQLRGLLYEFGITLKAIKQMCRTLSAESKIGRNSRLHVRRLLRSLVWEY